jgi:hypothetical protein
MGSLMNGSRDAAKKWRFAAMRAQSIGNGRFTARVPAQFAAVLDALQLHGASSEALRALHDSEWPGLLALCDRANFALPLALRGYRGLPEWVTERLQRNLADSSDRFKRTQSTYVEAATALAGAGVPWIVLKGFTQAPDFSPSPRFRLQGDIDIYTPRQYAASAVHALEGIGYLPNQQEDYSLADHPPTLMRFGEWKRSPNLYDPEMPLCMEVHFCLWNHAVWMIPLDEVDAFWGRRIQRNLGSLEFPALDTADHLGYFALHVLREIFGAGRVAHRLLELATFLDTRSDDARFWQEWRSLHSTELRQAEAVAMALATNWFSATMPLAVREEIDSLSPGLRAWIKDCGDSPLTAMERRTRDGRLLQMLLAQSSLSRWKILRGALSPGVIARPRKFAQRPEDPTQPQKPKRPRYLAYPIYLAHRAWLNGSAILQFVVHGLALCVSQFTFRRAES